MATDLNAAVEALSRFLARARLTDVVGGLEASMVGADAALVRSQAATLGIDRSLLASAIAVRAELGRISDLIHAAAIVLLLPRLLLPKEVIVKRPSLAAGNDPDRAYDVETDRRVAEFKLGVWTGHDAMRKRQVFKDLVGLAADGSRRQPELFVMGPAPAKFLRTSRAAAAWGLDRSPGMLRLFVREFGSPTVSIASFTAGPGSRVRITDISELLRQVLDEGSS